MIHGSEITTACAEWLATASGLAGGVGDRRAPGDDTVTPGYPYAIVYLIDNVPTASTFKRRSGLAEIDWQITVSALNQFQLGWAADKVAMAMTLEQMPDVTAGNGDTLHVMQVVKLPGGFVNSSPDIDVVSATLDFRALITIT